MRGMTIIDNRGAKPACVQRGQAYPNTFTRRGTPLYARYPLWTIERSQTPVAVAMHLCSLPNTWDYCNYSRTVVS